MKLPVTFGLLLLVCSCFAASSETIVPPSDPQTMKCQTKLFDQIFIAQVVAGGTKREKLETFARHAKNLTPEHLEAVLALINEAYAAKDPTEWLNTYWLPCMSQEEV